MERFNLRSFLLLLLAACFIASAFIPDFWIMVNYNLVFFLAFFCFGILNRRPLLIFLGLAFLSPYVHDLLNLDFAQWNLFSGIFLIGLALELLYGRSQKKDLTKDFKGYIYDVGGPTANFRFPSCKKQLTHGVCQNKQCLFPKPCKNLTVDHKDYIKLMREIRELPGIKKVFIRSGIRFDYCMADDDDTFMNELCKHYISGQLRVAPEHISDNVLKYMGKPENKVYEAFLKRYARINKKTGKEQFVVPYLMSSHPGSTMKEAIELAEYIRDLGYMPEQVQDFYPTPSTLSTCMYYTGLDPRTMEKVYTPVSPHEKAMQRALIQYRNPENYELVKEALLKNHREDLIGFDRHCLIPPRPMKNGYHTGGTNQGNSKQGSPKQGSQKKGKYTITQNTRTSRQHPAGQKSADNRKSGRSGTRKAGGRKR